LPNLALPRCCFLLLKHSGPAQACKGPRGEGQPSQVSDSLNPGIRCHISGTVEEPRPSDESVRIIPGLQDTQVVAYFLHLRARKPGKKQGDG